MPKNGDRKSKRSRAKYPGLSHDLNLKTRYEEIDFDYLDKLSPEELKFLNNFVEEEIHADFRHKGKKLNTTKKAKRRIYSKNNARNRDIYSRASASHRLDYFSGINENIGSNYDLEKLVYKIDLDRKEQKKIKKG